MTRCMTDDACDCDCHAPDIGEAVSTSDDFDTLRSLADRIRQESEHVSYGYFPGGDPRDFTPDEEMCDAEEVARWKLACNAWERGECADVGGPHEHFASEDGSVYGHVTKSHFGMGSFVYRDAPLSALAQELDDWCDRARRHGL